MFGLDLYPLEVKLPHLWDNGAKVCGDGVYHTRIMEPYVAEHARQTKSVSAKARYKLDRRVFGNCPRT